MDALLSELTGIVGPEHVLTDPGLVAGYVTDWTRRFRGVARAVIRPGDTGHVARALLTGGPSPPSTASAGPRPRCCT